LNERSVASTLPLQPCADHQVGQTVLALIMYLRWLLRARHTPDFPLN